VWIAFPERVDDQENRGAQILNLLSRATKDKSLALALSSSGFLFRLLLQFGIS